MPPRPGGTVHDGAVRRGRRRRRAQRPGRRHLPGPRRAQGPRAGAPADGRRGLRDRGAVPRLPALLLLLHLPPAPGAGDPRPRPAAATASRCSPSSRPGSTPSPTGATWSCGTTPPARRRRSSATRSATRPPIPRWIALWERAAALLHPYFLAPAPTYAELAAQRPRDAGRGAPRDAPDPADVGPRPRALRVGRDARPRAERPGPRRSAGARQRPRLRLHQGEPALGPGHGRDRQGRDGRHHAGDGARRRRGGRDDPDRRRGGARRRAERPRGRRRPRATAAASRPTPSSRTPTRSAPSSAWSRRTPSPASSGSRSPRSRPARRTSSSTRRSGSCRTSPPTSGRASIPGTSRR